VDFGGCYNFASPPVGFDDRVRSGNDWMVNGEESKHAQPERPIAMAHHGLPAPW
jgi:hypothetical protein